MRKYAEFSKITFLEHIVYRTNFLLWRLRIFISVLITYFLWQSVFSGSISLFSYSREQMSSYIILILAFAGITQSTQTSRISQEIKSGKLADYLLKPVKYFRILIFRDISDKSLNIFSAVFEILILSVLFKVQIIYSHDIKVILMSFLFLVIGSVLYFEINSILSLVSFWSVDSWGPRFVFYILVSFLSGAYFPLDISGGTIYSLLSLLPFPYLLFFPIRVLLGGVEGWFLIKGLAVSVLWMLMLYLFLKWAWKRGLENYTDYGG